MEPLLVFSHLRWNFVYQRPQHLMTRLARHYRIFFIEEPVLSEGDAYMTTAHPAPNVKVCTPYTPFTPSGFHDEQLATLQSLVAGLVNQHQIANPIVWLYTPMALPLVLAFNPRSVVYDCMDELSAFKNAPRQLLQRERALYQTADLVFTGGPSLHRAKKARHSSVHCFPSSVDCAHFAAARDPLIEISAQQQIPHPRFGFFGVLDERLDLGLLDRMALSHPDWQIIMVGPVVKIDPRTLPKRSNIHYLGQQSYADLPRYLAGWDVCILPFALNEATRFISPTKTLEYMAAEKPVVSTPVEDVATLYGDTVAIGTQDEFISLCERALLESPVERASRVAKIREAVSRTSWDKTALDMQRLIESHSPRAIPDSVSPAFDFPDMAAVKSYRVVIVGAGPTGLSAAYHLGQDYALLEQGPAVGGWCRSFVDNGFTFDCAGHIMFSNDAYVKALYRVLLGDNVHWQDREAWIYSKEVYTRYPFQGALYGLPPEVITECIIGAMEARMGTSRETNVSKISRGGMRSSANECKTESITDCCADDAVERPETAAANDAQTVAHVPGNFEDFIYQVWGKGIAKHFALPYNRKLWAVPLATMETSWLGGRVPLPNLSEMVEGALRPVVKPMGPNARFGYPLRGGFQALMDGFLPHLRGTLKLDSQVARIFPSRHMAVLGDGTVYRYEKLINTTPLPALVKMAGEEAPPRVRLAATKLRHVSVRCVNLGIGREHVTDKHWIYYPETSLFHRIFVQGNASPHCNPPGGFGLTCEITYSPDKPLPLEGDALIDRCIEDAIAVGIINSDDKIIARNMVDMPYAYVVYDHERAGNVAVIRQWADLHDIILAGRYSEWEYYNSDHAFIAGRNAALSVELAADTLSGVGALAGPTLDAKSEAQATP